MDQNTEYVLRFKPGMKRLLPQKLVFDLWLKLGTVSLITDELKKQGYKSKNRELSSSLVKHTLDSFLVDNYLEAKEQVLKQVLENDNTVLSDLQYELWIAKKAFRLWYKSNPSRLNLWLAAHPELLNKEFYSVYKSYLDEISKNPNNVVDGFIGFVLANNSEK